MSTPTPVILPPTATIDPTTPGPSTKPTALGAALTTGLAGTPVAALIMWLVDTYWTVNGKHLDPTSATIVGGTLVSAIGYGVHVVRGLWSQFRK